MPANIGERGEGAVKIRGGWCTATHIARQHEPLDKEVEPDGLLVLHCKMILGEAIGD